MFHENYLMSFYYLSCKLINKKKTKYQIAIELYQYIVIMNFSEVFKQLSHYQVN